MANELIQRTKEMVQKRQLDESSGHDWRHTERVWKMARHLAEKESETINKDVVELAALLHDIADWKFHDGDETVGPQIASEWLKENGINKETTEHVAMIIRDLSYKGSENTVQMQTLEGKIVQDADRLDAVGHIGIARTFAYGGHAGHAMFDPTIKPRTHLSPEEYKDQSVKSSTFNHFFEKLLLLKDSYHTEEAKRIGQKRHDDMILFLRGFVEEMGVDASIFHKMIDEYE